MAHVLFESGIAALGFARKATLGFFEDIPDNKVCHQPIPGANHALWILGHLACTDEFFLNKVGGKPFNRFEKWNGIFFMKSTPTPNVSDYPPVSEVKQVLDENRQRLLQWVDSMKEADALLALPEDLKTFAPNRAALLSTMAWHEGLHAGQLTVIRKSLGIGAKFG